MEQNDARVLGDEIKGLKGLERIAVVVDEDPDKILQGLAEEGFGRLEQRGGSRVVGRGDDGDDRAGEGRGGGEEELVRRRSVARERVVVVDHELFVVVDGERVRGGKEGGGARVYEGGAITWLETIVKAF
jgi:hypothetical protein